MFEAELRWLKRSNHWMIFSGGWTFLQMTELRERSIARFLRLGEWFGELPDFLR